MRRASHTSGFTLLEMLVAMALMVVLAGALYASLHTAFAGRRASERALEPVRRAAGALDMAERSLQAAAPPTGILAAEFLGLDGDDGGGEPADRLAFHVLADDREAQPPCPFRRVEIGLATEEQTGQVALVRRTVVNLLAPEAPEPAEEALCRRVRSFDARYYDGSAWTDAWDSTASGDVLPLAVELSLTVEDGSEEGYLARRILELPCAGTAGGAGGSAGPPGGQR